MNKLCQSNIKAWLQNNILMVIITIGAFFLLFMNLGNAYAPIDEANTLMLSKNTAIYGFPTIWDGDYMVVPYSNDDVSSDLAWVAHPWLQFYVTAASFKLFGYTNVAARLPFAFAGLLSIVSIYFLTKYISGSKRMSQISSLLLTFNTAFLLYSRAARYYSITIIFSILILYFFLKWIKEKNFKNSLLYVISSVLLFHSYYPFWAFVTLAIGIYGLYHIIANKLIGFLKQFILSHIIIGLLTLTWFIYAPPHGPVDTKPQLDDWFFNFKIYIWKLNTWLVPIYTLAAILLVMLLITKLVKIIKNNRAKESKINFNIKKTGIHMNSHYTIFLCVPLYIAFISTISMLTTQYVMPAIPYMTIIAAFLIMKIKEYNKWVGCITLAACLSTNILNIAPYIIVDKSGINLESAKNFIVNPRCDFTEGTTLEHFIKDEMAVRSYQYDFISSLFLDYDNRLEGIITYLQENGNENQTVLACWADANALRFYTGMHVVYEFLPIFDNSEVIETVQNKKVEPDWVLQDTLVMFEPSDPFYSYNKENYKLIEILYPKEFFDNHTNLDFFKFKTNYLDAPQSFYILGKEN